MHVALAGYTHRTSGCGLFSWDMYRNGLIDSILSVANPVKGQEKWSDKQTNWRGTNADGVREHINEYRPDWFIGIETFFFPGFYDVCRELGVKTCLVVMPETYWQERPTPTLFLCPTARTYDKVSERNKVYYPWPVDARDVLTLAEALPDDFRPVEPERTWRTKPKRVRKFLHVMGYGGVYNRKQTRQVLEGFMTVKDDDLTLTMGYQQPWWKEYGYETIPDPRIKPVPEVPNWFDLYTDHDVLIQPDAFAGYCRPLYEAMACGIPAITTDGPPMNEAVTRARWLLSCQQTLFKKDGTNAISYLVTAETIAAKIRETRAWDLRDESREAIHRVMPRLWTPLTTPDIRRLLGGWS